MDGDPLCQEPRRFCGFFRGKLEETGAIEWRDAWTITIWAQRARVRLVRRRFPVRTLEKEPPMSHDQETTIADVLRGRGFHVRTGAQGAQLEGSKTFSKNSWTQRHPHRSLRQLHRPRACACYVRELGAPIVVKADGLALARASW